MTNLDTQLPGKHSGQLISPDLRLRHSTMLWGPLRVCISFHREGVEIGYYAGEKAHQDLTHGQDQGISISSLDTLEVLMNAYLALPRYYPRQATTKMLSEWRAMFVLGWTNQALQAMLPSTEAPDLRTQKGPLDQEDSSLPT